MITFTASIPNPPDNLSLKAHLTWEYFFGSCPGGWCCINTSDGCWIITDEAADLDTATVFPDDDSFISWLESVCDEHLQDDCVGFLKQFFSVPELITPEVATVMEIAINKDSTTE